MRKVYDSSGADVTSSASSFLQNNRTLVLADLYTLAMFDPWTPSSTPNFYCYTSAAFQISVSKLQMAPTVIQTLNQTWIPNVIERGNLEYSIGLNVTSLEVSWWPDDTQTIPNNSKYTWKEAALSGYLDSSTFWLHRAFFQVDTSNNVAGLLGTSLMWNGMIQGVEAKREYIKFTVPSLLQAFHDCQVPSQVVQAGQRNPPYLPTGPVVTISGYSAASSTPMNLFFGSSGIADHDARDCFISAYPSGAISPGNPRPIGVRVRDNVGGHFYLYEPVDPSAVPSTCRLFYVEDIGATAIPGAQGFPVVPPPEASV